VSLCLLYLGLLEYVQWNNHNKRSGFGSHIFSDRERCKEERPKRKDTAQKVLPSDALLPSHDKKMSACAKRNVFLCRSIVVAVSLFSFLVRDDVVLVKAIISELFNSPAFSGGLLLDALNDVLLKDEILLV